MTALYLRSACDDRSMAPDHTHVRSRLAVALAARDARVAGECEATGARARTDARYESLAAFVERALRDVSLAYGRAARAGGTR